jgi:hypothetical protein
MKMRLLPTLAGLVIGDSRMVGWIAEGHSTDWSKKGKAVGGGKQLIHIVW